MKKVVALALFGDGDRYAQYLRSFVLAHLNLFPIRDDWRLRIHVDAAMCKSPLLSWLGPLTNFVETHVLKEPPILTKAMLWRMAPAFDPEVDYVFPRDLDACPMPRDLRACQEFIRSEATVHTVHDAPVHVGVMGGLCGFRTAALRGVTGWKCLDHLYHFANQTVSAWAQHGTDQIVLNRMLERYPSMTLLEHRYHGWHAGPGAHPPREASIYPCQAWSTPLADEGPADLDGLRTPADRLANHLGAAGYDHEAAWRFWMERGDPILAAHFRACPK